MKRAMLNSPFCVNSYKIIIINNDSFDKNIKAFLQILFNLNT